MALARGTIEAHISKLISLGDEIDRHEHAIRRASRARKALIAELYPQLSYREIGRAIGISQARISQFMKET